MKGHPEKHEKHERVEKHEHIEKHRESGRESVTRAVDQELRDIAAALRSLDQSYYYKGFRNGNHAWVAGSAFLDPQRRADRERIRVLEQRLRELEARARKKQVVEAPRVRCVELGWRAGRELAGERRGRAFVDRAGTLHLGQGSVLMRSSTKDLIAACRATNRLTLEAIFTAADLKATGPARIVSLSSDQQSRNVTLAQDGDRLVLRLRTTETDENGTNPEVSLTRIKAGVRYHVLVTYRPGRILCFLNGEQVMETGAVEGTFANWSPQRLVLGDEVNGGRDWRGTLEWVTLRSCLPDDLPNDRDRNERRSR